MLHGEHAQQHCPPSSPRLCSAVAPHLLCKQLVTLLKVAVGSQSDSHGRAAGRRHPQLPLLAAGTGCFHRCTGLHYYLHRCSRRCCRHCTALSVAASGRTMILGTLAHDVLASCCCCCCTLANPHTTTAIAPDGMLPDLWSQGPEDRPAA